MPTLSPSFRCIPFCYLRSNYDAGESFNWLQVSSTIGVPLSACHHQHGPAWRPQFAWRPIGHDWWTPKKMHQETLVELQTMIKTLWNDFLANACKNLIVTWVYIFEQMKTSGFCKEFLFLIILDKEQGSHANLKRERWALRNPHESSSIEPLLVMGEAKKSRSLDWGFNSAHHYRWIPRQRVIRNKHWIAII